MEEAFFVADICIWLFADFSRFFEIFCARFMCHLFTSLFFCSVSLFPFLSLSFSLSLRLALSLSLSLSHTYTLFLFVCLSLCYLFLSLSLSLSLSLFLSLPQGQLSREYPRLTPMRLLLAEAADDELFGDVALAHVDELAGA